MGCSGRSGRPGRQAGGGTGAWLPFACSFARSVRTAAELASRQAARAVLRNAAELLGRERTTTRAALVAMLEPMKLTPANGGGPFYEVEAKTRIPANQEVSREVLNKTGCGDRI